MKRPLATALLLLAAAAPARAQGGVYRAQPDTLFYRIVNDYRIWLVRGGDTLGAPVREVGVERQLWKAAGPELAVLRLRTGLDVRRQTRRDSLAVAPLGRVAAIDGDTNAPRGEYDLVPRFPRPLPLAAGAAWSDTLAKAHPTPGGPYALTLVRDYRVESAAGGALEVRGTGTVRYRDAFAADSGGHWWLDVRGPVTERFVFSAEGARPVSREWRMELRGTAGLPGASGGVDTVPAGLVSTWRQDEVPPALARALTRELPRGDTSVTTGGPLVLLHTIDRRPDAIESGLARSDGAVATARSEWALGALTRYTVTWTDTAGPAEHTVERQGRGGDRLRLRGGGRDTVVAAPELPWAVADVGMEEHLAPTLRAPLLGGVRFPFAVYRPRAGRWDQYEATVRSVAGARLVTLADSAGTATHLLIADDGDLLVAGRPDGAEERLPLPGSRRRDRVDDYVALIRGGRDHRARH